MIMSSVVGNKLLACVSTSFHFSGAGHLDAKHCLWVAIHCSTAEGARGVFRIYHTIVLMIILVFLIIF